MNDEELTELTSLSSAGSIEATLKLFSYYVSTNQFETGFLFLQRLEGVNNPTILSKIANCYENGIGVNKNSETAISYYQRALDNGSDQSAFNIALILYKENKHSEAVPYLLIGANNNHVQSLKMLAEFYYKGIGVVKDLDVALNFFKKLEALSSPNSMIMVASILYELKRYDEAYKKLLDCYKENIVQSYSLLADCYLFGFGTTQNSTQAIKILEFGAQQNNKNCIAKLIKIYENGIGVEKDLDKVKFLHEKLTKLVKS